MKIVYIARANTLITRRGELWEVTTDMERLVHQKTGHSIPVVLVQNFDKYFITLFDPKVYAVGGAKVYVTKAGINVDGKDIDVAEWCHYTDLFDKTPFKVKVVKYFGLHLTIEALKQITEYYLLLNQPES